MSLNILVRRQILAEGPDIASEQDWKTQADYEARRTQYIDEQLNAMSVVELLERISDALGKPVGCCGGDDCSECPR